jgi:hypothetical protein
MKALLLFPALVLAGLVQPAAAALPAPPVPTAPAVQQALSALDKLAQYGYVVNTPARADRAIRHWQRANGLVVDGIVGAQTLGSLDLPATATVPAVRVSPPAAPAAQSVDDMIRAAWPDDSEGEAVRIATRESRLQPDARNACCYGLFQIYFTVHRGWLAELGVTSAGQLLDAETNIAAALALFQRSGWQPWTL